MRLLLLAAGFSLVAAMASAQDSTQQGPAGGQDRQGFWLSVGAGLGSRGLSCYNCIGAQREQGFSATIRMGGTTSRQFTFGANIIGWIKSNSEAAGGRYAVFGALMGVGQLYPVRRTGLFMQGGLGYVVDVVDDDLVIHGVGMTFGVGVDLRVGRAFSLTPQLNYVRTLDGGAITSSLYQFGIAATWH